MPLTNKEYGLTYLTRQGIILVALVVSLSVGGLVFGILYLVHQSDEDYKHKCEGAGGRVVQVNSDNICVEKETDRLLWV